MNKTTSQKTAPASQRLYPRAYAHDRSRRHLQPMYTSVWLALIQGLMNPAAAKRAGKAAPPA